MIIQAYFDQTQAVVNRYAATRFVVEAKINFDQRPGEQGYLSGAMDFVDGSVSSFREFLDILHETVDKLMYSYHYQDAEEELIFRYDNAAHKPPLPTREHKHLPERIVVAPAPTLSEVLAEIFTNKGWLLT